MAFVWYSIKSQMDLLSPDLHLLIHDDGLQVLHVASRSRVQFQRGKHRATPHLQQD